MKSKDFENFKVSINLSIEIDGVLRSITEQIKLIHQTQNTDALRTVIDILRLADNDIDTLIHENLCKDESEN